MIWDDAGFLLSKNKYNENSLIAEIYTENHGKVSGIIFGGTSKKLKNYLQIGNKFHVNYNFKNISSIGYFKVEILNALTPQFFDDNKKLSSITAAMSLLKILTAENQSNIQIFYLIESFFKNLNSDNWFKDYIFWELELFKLLGYNLDFSSFVKKEIVNDKNYYYVTSTLGKKEVPNFLIEKNLEIIELNKLLKGFKLVGDFLDKTILKPNNISYPLSRDQFYNSFK